MACWAKTSQNPLLKHQVTSDRPHRFQYQKSPCLFRCLRSDGWGRSDPFGVCTAGSPLSRYLLPEGTGGVYRQFSDIRHGSDRHNNTPPLKYWLIACNHNGQMAGRLLCKCPFMPPLVKRNVVLRTTELALFTPTDAPSDVATLH